MAVVGGTFGAWSAGTAAQPTAIARPIGLLRPAQPSPAHPPSARQPSAPSQAPELDAFLAIASKPASDPAAGTSIGARKAAKAAPAPRQIAIRLLHKFGWSRRQFRYLDPLWSRESSWNVRAFNLYSGAYGIPQAVPGGKMASAGPHWKTSASTQIRWGMRYIKDRYGSPRGAWEHELATGWY